MQINYPYLKIITRRSRSKKSKKIIKKNYYYFRNKKLHKINVSPDHPQFHKMYTAIHSGFSTETHHGSVNWMCDLYLASPDYNSKAMNTKKSYNRHIKKFKDLYGDIKVALITRSDVQAIKKYFVELISEDGANKFLATFRILFNQEEVREMVPINPVATFGKIQTVAREQIWSEEDVALLHEHKDDLDKNDYMIILLGIYTLQRIGDILELKRENYDGEKITLKQAKTKMKVNKVVGIRVHKALKKPLDEYVLTHNESTLVKKTSYDSFQKKFLKFKKRHGLEENSFHDLRRTGMVRMAELGVTDIQISAISGHTIEETKKILETYLPRNYKMGKAAIEKWESGTV